jgi:hypothetical protein
MCQRTIVGCTSIPEDDIEEAKKEVSEAKGTDECFRIETLKAVGS